VAGCTKVWSLPMPSFVLSILMLSAPAASSVEQALELLRAGDAPAAHRILHQHLTVAPDDAAAWSALGSALLLQKRFAEAADAFARSRALDPADAAAPFGEAEARMALGESDAASVLYQAYFKAEKGRSESLDAVAAARLKALAPTRRVAGKPGDALPSQLLLGGAGGLAGMFAGGLGAGLVVAAVVTSADSLNANDVLIPLTFVTAFALGAGATLGGIAYGVRHAGRTHRIHGSLWRGMGGALVGGIGGGLVTGVLVLAADDEGIGGLGILLVPLGAVLGAAYANNTVLQAPSAVGEAARWAPRRVPSVLVMPAR
jgi:hypothetical protein